MDDEALVDDVFDRLTADAAVSGPVADLVVASLLGDEAMVAVVEGQAPDRPVLDAEPETEPAATYVTEIAVEGFRGIGAEAVLAIAPGPGLTLVVGRNGSGKSSFAEGLELLMTGENSRWTSKKTKVWQDGWRNLHHPHPTSLRATFAVDGEAGSTSLSRTWEEGADLASSRSGGSSTAGPTSIDDLGWTAALTAYRPFLSHDELGSMLEEGPSALFDRLSSILGLEDLVAAEQRLKDARKSVEQSVKDAKAQLPALREQLEAVEDDRAGRCLAAIKGASAWKLDEVEVLVSGGESASADDELTGLDQLRHLTVPSPEEVGAAAEALRAAAAAQQAIQGSDGDRARRVAALLDEAITFHADHGDGDCPVCGRDGALSAGWRTDAEVQRDQLRAEAAAAETAHRQMQQARSAAESLVGPAPAVVTRASALGLGDDLADAWARWAAVPATADADGLAEHLEDTIVDLHASGTAATTKAAGLWQERQDLWRPVALAVAEWLPLARTAMASTARLQELKTAEKWVQEVAKIIRNERFAPIAAEVRHNWEMLRTNSNVSIDELSLEGSATRRRVELGVSVDDVEAVALGVMSQGELHALALCLFLPRATLAASPFRFTFIDDPVQAMDPARVDGLARLLASVAEQRQVVVFTHDDRLPEAVRRLTIPARIVEVHRRAGSAVELRPGLDPTKRCLDDALSLALTENLPDNIRRRLVPNFCRQGMEAACADTVRRRRLGRGEPHDAVEATLMGQSTFLQRLALALFDDPDRSGEVMAHLNNKFGSWAGDAVKTANKGSHELTPGDLKDLVHQSRRLATEVGKLS